MADVLASGLCPPIGEAFFLPEWQVLAAAALAASAAILAMLYLINRFFENEAGEASVKLELFELFTTVFIVVAVVALIDSFCQIPVGAFLSSPDTAQMNLFDSAAWVLDDFSEDLIISASVLHFMYIPFDFLTTTTLTQQPLGMGTVLHPTAGIGAVIKPGLINALQMIAVSFVIIRAEFMILDFTSFAFIKYYLPLGILLRSFTPTRRIGGTIIGLSLGFVLAYPALIFINGLTMESMNPFSLQTLNYLGGLVGSAWEPLTEFSKSSLSLYEPLTILTFLKTFLGSVFGTIVSVYFAFAIRTAAAAFLIGLFFPALNALLLVTIIRYLTKAFGEEVDVSNLTRMI